MRVALIVAVMAVVVAVAGCSDLDAEDSINGDTPCSEYLAADPADKERVVRELAVEQDSSQAGGAFLLLNTDAICGTDLERPLRDAIPK